MLTKHRQSPDFQTGMLPGHDDHDGDADDDNNDVDDDGNGDAGYKWW